MYKRFFFLSLTCIFLMAPSAFAATVNQIIAASGRELDRQVVSSLGLESAPAKGVSLMITTPVSINNFEQTNPLARQIQEELATWFVQSGYNVQEIRKGADILFNPDEGELLLTRRANLISKNAPESTATMVGTYALTGKSVRFSIKLVRTQSLQIIAMSSFSIPLTSEMSALLYSEDGLGRTGSPIHPTVTTRLP